MKNRYFYLARPPMYGHQPDKFTSWTPSPSGKCERLPMTRGGTIWAFGYVDYPDPLPLDKIWRYDLFPDDPVQWAHYRFFIQADRDPVAAQLMEKDCKANYQDPHFRKYSSEEIVEATRILVENGG